MNIRLMTVDGFTAKKENHSNAISSIRASDYWRQKTRSSNSWEMKWEGKVQKQIWIRLLILNSWWRREGFKKKHIQTWFRPVDLSWLMTFRPSPLPCRRWARWMYTKVTFMVSCWLTRLVDCYFFGRTSDEKKSNQLNLIRALFWRQFSSKMWWFVVSGHRLPRKGASDFTPPNT